MKHQIKLNSIHHRNQSCIAIGFSYDTEIKRIVKTINGVRWSKTHGVFYLPNTKANLHLVFSKLHEQGHYVDYSALKTPLPKQATVKVKKGPIATKTEFYRDLPDTHKTILKGYVDFLKGKRLSTQTIKTYGYFSLRFLHYNRAIVPGLWNTKTIDNFMSYVMAKEDYSISSHRQSVSALKHLSAFCELPQFNADRYGRPKKSKYLPIVLSKEEIITLLQVTKNLKHRAILGLLYSGGLRIGELLNLKIRELDFNRGLILIQQGKGRKDRVVIMSDAIRPLLLNYLKTYTPKTFFAEGRDNQKYSAVSVRQFLKRSCQAAGIAKHVTPHCLRHSYATHMLEQGVDIRYIQELLGHAKPETTMIYTHVAQKDLKQIKNPLDVIVGEISKMRKENKKVLLSRTNNS